MVLKLDKSRYQIQELTKRWAKLFDETITDSYILQWAIDYKFSLYTTSPGALQVNLWTRLELGSPQRKIVAYLSNEFIKLTDDHIRSLLGNKSTTILFLNLSESDFIQGDEPFDLPEIEMAILDEKDRIEITPDDISYLSVTVEDVIAFEQELRRKSKASNQGDDTVPKEQELTQWLRATWNDEERLGGTAFFMALKKYVGKKGSPITEHYSAGKDAGFKWQNSKGTVGEMKKSTLLNIVSKFRKKPE
ncbi:MAG: hypothetical protein ACXWAT_02465 [Methylobacter sp.]